MEALKASLAARQDRPAAGRRGGCAERKPARAKGRRRQGGAGREGPQGEVSARLRHEARRSGVDAAVTSASRFRTADVARVLGVSPPRVRAMVRAGWCRPGRAGRAYTFDFQDLVLLRTAHGLLRRACRRGGSSGRSASCSASCPPIGRSPACASTPTGGSVVVRDGDAVWQPDSGQLLLDFAVDELARQQRRRARRAPARPRQPRGASAGENRPADWFERALALEDDDPEAARAAYRARPGARSRPRRRLRQPRPPGAPGRRRRHRRALLPPGPAARRARPGDPLQPRPRARGPRQARRRRCAHYQRAVAPQSRASPTRTTTWASCSTAAAGGPRRCGT